MNVVENDVRILVDKELAAANERFPQFNSQHEGYAVIKEEVDELKEYTDLINNRMIYLWSKIRFNNSYEELVSRIYDNAINAACEAIQVVTEGDGNKNPAEAFTIGDKTIGGTAGTLSYDALLKFWAQFDPYTMNTILVSGDVMLQMLRLSEFQNPLTGLNFQGTGTLTTPLGATLLRTSAMPAGKLIGLDKHYALEMVTGGDVLVEYDKLIDRQLERAAITSISGFAKLYQDASKVLSIQ